MLQPLPDYSDRVVLIVITANPATFHNRSTDGQQFQNMSPHSSIACIKLLSKQVSQQVGHLYSVTIVQINSNMLSVLVKSKNDFHINVDEVCTS